MITTITLVGTVIACLGLLLFILVGTYAIYKSIYYCFLRGAVGDGLIKLGFLLILGGAGAIGIAQYVLKGFL